MEILIYDKTLTIKPFFPVMAFDDDDDMKRMWLSGDWDSDCLMKLDRN